MARYETQVRTRSRDHSEGRWRQSCCSLISFTVVFAMSSLFCQAMRQYIVSQVTSLEKQFGLSSTRSGLLVASEDIGYVVAILFIGHFGRYGNIPRILGTTIVVIGVTGTMSGVSYFISPDTLPSGNDHINKNVSGPGSVCVEGSSVGNMKCGHEDNLLGGARVRSNEWMVGFLTAMGILQGGAQSARYTLGAPYIEDNAVSKAQSTLLNGIVLVVDYLGTPLALGLGSVASNIPLDLKETLLFPGHPQWIGAWWLGYLVLGAFTLLSVLPLFFYPRTIPRNLQQGLLQDKTDLTLKQKVLDLPKCLCRLLKNPVFVLLVCGNCFLVLFLAGSMTFDPKYVETQFMVPAYQANYIVGAVGLVVLVVGTLGGAIITSRLKMTNQECLRFTVICMGVGMALFSMLLVFGCENPDIVGLQEHGVNTSLSADCVCDVNEYFPMCGEDGKNYKSPCFAGCTNKTETTYSSCSGISTVGGVGMGGLCPHDCNYLYYYVVVEAISGVLGALPVVAILMTIMRCVDADDKTMSMAVMSFVFSLLGFLPAPILYGAVIDSTCKKWGQSCDGHSACTLYDLPLLRTRVKGMDVGFQLTAFVLYIVTYLLYKLKVVKNNEQPEDATAMDVLQAHV